MSFMYNCFASNQSVTDGQKCLFFPIRKENGFHTVSLLDNDNKEYIVNNNTKFGSGYNAFWDFLSVPYIEGHYYEDEGFVLDDNETNRITVINFLDYLYDHSLISKEGENSVHELSFNVKDFYKKNEEYSFSQLSHAFNVVWAMMQKKRVFVKENNAASHLLIGLLHEKAKEYINNDYDNEYIKDLVTKSLNEKFNLLKMFFNHNVFGEVFRSANYKDGKWRKEGFDDEFFEQAFFVLNLTELADRLCSKEGGFYCLNSRSNLNSKEIIDLFFDFFDKNSNATNFDDAFVDKFLGNEFVKKNLLIKKLSGFMNDNNITLSPSVVLTRYYDNSSGKEFAKFVSSVNKEINKSKIKKGI